MPGEGLPRSHARGYTYPTSSFACAALTNSFDTQAPKLAASWPALCLSEPTLSLGSCCESAPNWYHSIFSAKLCLPQLSGRFMTGKDGSPSTRDGSAEPQSLIRRPLQRKARPSRNLLLTCVIPLHKDVSPTYASTLPRYQRRYNA